MKSESLMFRVGFTLIGLGVMIIVLTALLLLCLCVEVANSIATATLHNGRNRNLLKQLHEIGMPNISYYFDDDWGCRDHTSACTTLNCPVKQAEAYEELLKQCALAGIKPWRTRLATGQLPGNFGIAMQLCGT